MSGRDDAIVCSCFGNYCPYAAFVGGFPAWKAAGYPVETGPRVGF